MKIRALCAFSGTISMAKGDVCECTDQYAIDDLLQAGYIEAVEAPPDAPDEAEPDTSGEAEPDQTELDTSAEDVPDEAEPDTSDGTKKRAKRKKAE